jgi:hypothetical protein
MNPMACYIRRLVPPAFVLVLAIGCRSIGPGTVQRDRLHYSAAVAESWKEQLLLNIVKTRYGDAPAFMEVSSLVSGYSLETGVSINGQFSPENLRGDTFAGGELSGKFTDRPTISYVPMTGERFARSLLAPIPLDAIMFVIQGGTPADFMLGLAAHSCEGYFNQGVYGGQFQAGDPGFAQLLPLLRTLQQARVVEANVTKDGERTECWFMFNPRPEHAQATADFTALLNLPPHTNRVRVVFGLQDPAPEVIAIRTRSLMQILNALGVGVSVPQEHVASGRALPVGTTAIPSRLTVHSSKRKPDDAFVAVPYEGHWFYIGQEDLPSRSTLSAVTVLFSFLDTMGKSSAPVLTIPAN